jgi:hypothetical protein
MNIDNFTMKIGGFLKRFKFPPVYVHIRSRSKLVSLKANGNLVSQVSFLFDT